VSTALSSAPVDRIRRVDLLAYVLALTGISFVTTFAADSFERGSTVAAAGATLAGLCIVVGALEVRRNPGNVRRGTDPAPVWFYVLAAVATLGFGAATAIQFVFL
jgi:hypothetical protein